MKRLIYADANATYPVAAEHYRRVASKLIEVDGNPSSIHARGRSAKVALEDSREQLAKLFGANHEEIIFTSGATEANNMVIHGISNKPQNTGSCEILIGSTEHPAVREPAFLSEKFNRATVKEIPVSKEGFADKNWILENISEKTKLIALMHANNEVGTINDVVSIADAVKKINPEIHFHVDAVQTFGKLPLDNYANSSIDSAAISAHKVGGFKGIGALYLRRGIKLAKLVSGGGQERSRRPGTENMPGIISLGLRAKDLKEDIEQNWWSPAQKAKMHWIETLNRIDGMHIHGIPESDTDSIANTVHFHIDGVSGDDILLNFDLAGILSSSGSACSSGVSRPSHVLTAMGYDDWSALNSIRTSFSNDVTIDDINYMSDVLHSVVNKSRQN